MGSCWNKGGLCYNRAMKTLIAIAVSLTIVLAANAAGYDYEVEYVKSAHGSCVKTDLIPEPGLTFKMDLMFEGPFNQIFGGKFDMAKNTTVFFGQEDAEYFEPDEVGDDSIALLARDISKKIESELEYPGQIKVNVVRETRAIDYAK